MKKLIIAILFLFTLQTSALATDSHKNQKGNGHTSHGNGRGLGHCKSEWKVMSKKVIGGKKYCLNSDGSIGETGDGGVTCGADSEIAKNTVVPEVGDDWSVTTQNGSDYYTKIAYDSSHRKQWMYHSDTDSYDVFTYNENGAVDTVVNDKGGVTAKNLYYEDSNVRKTLIQCYPEGSRHRETGYVGDVTLYNEDGTRDIRITTKMSSGELTYKFSQLKYDEYSGDRIGQEYHPATDEEIDLYNQFFK